MWKSQLIESRGFKAEDHYVETKDGYILLVTRIVNPYVKEKKSLQPIVLQHGWMSNANTWIINSMARLDRNGHYIEDNDSGSVGNNLGFVLAINGFDVWLSNMRGTPYSLNHSKWSAKGMCCMSSRLFIHNSSDQIPSIGASLLTKWLNTICPLSLHTSWGPPAKVSIARIVWNLKFALVLQKFTSTSDDHGSTSKKPTFQSILATPLWSKSRAFSCLVNFIPTVILLNFTWLD